MRKEIAKKWAKELRSGKYKQGHSYLKIHIEDKKPNYCCLGVLCEIYNAQMKKQKKKLIKETFDEAMGVYLFGNREDILPNKIKKWAGVKHGEGKFNNVLKNGIKDLATMNDCGYSFSKIASFIEKNSDEL